MGAWTFGVVVPVGLIVAAAWQTWLFLAGFV
jgi:hypothetical protein